MYATLGLRYGNQKGKQDKKTGSPQLDSVHYCKTVTCLVQYTASLYSTGDRVHSRVVPGELLTVQAEFVT